tara:strand:+ start:236 stop:439 length:204 start_codon:yes stop_codon:yes gene_type:complete
MSHKVRTGKYEVVDVTHFKTFIDGKEVTRKRVRMAEIVIERPTVADIKVKKEKKQQQKKSEFIPLFD